MSGLKNDVQGQKSFLQVVTGVDRPSAKRYRTLNHHVKRAVAAYGRAEILVYYDMVATGLMISFPQLFPGSILLPRVNGVDGRRPCNTASHARPGPILSVFFALIVHSELKGSTSVERRLWSAS